MKWVCVLLIAASWAVWPAEADVAPQPAGELRKHDNLSLNSVKYICSYIMRNRGLSSFVYYVGYYRIITDAGLKQYVVSSI